MTVNKEEIIYQLLQYIAMCTTQNNNFKTTSERLLTFCQKQSKGIHGRIIAMSTIDNGCSHSPTIKKNMLHIHFDTLHIYLYNTEDTNRKKVLSQTFGIYNR